MNTRLSTFNPTFNASLLSPWRLRTTLLLLLFVNLTFLASAQTKVWDKTFGTEYKFYQLDPNDEFNVVELGDENLAALLATPDGGYLFGGPSDSGVSGHKTEPNRGAIGTTDFWIIKINANGNKVWDRTFGGSGNDVLSTIVATPDGGYLLGGTSTSSISGDKSQVSKGNGDYWLVKINSNGQKVWDKAYGGTGGDVLMKIIATPDNGYLLGGYSNSGMNGDKAQASKGSDDYWVVKINNNGDKLWDKTLGGSLADHLSTLVATPDGNYLLGGTSWSGISGDKSEADRDNSQSSWESGDYWVIKLNAEGNKLWDKTFGGTRAERLSSLVALSDNSFFIGGTSQSDINGDKTAASKDTIDTYDARGDYWIIKAGAGGNKLWDRTFGGNKVENLTALIATPDGNILLGGYSNSNISGDKFENNLGYYKSSFDYWVVKMAANGDKLWDETLGGNETEQLSALTTTPDGSYLLGGFSQSDISGDKSEDNINQGSDYWLVKIKDNGKRNQSITFNPIPDQTLGVGPIQLAVQVSSGLPITFTISGPAKLSGTTLTITGAGTISIKASQAGNATYNPALDVTRTFTVKRVTLLEQWSKQFGGDKNEAGTALIATPDGGYLLGGSSTSDANGDKSEASKGSYDYWIVKVDKNGNKLWDKTYGGNKSDRLSTIVATKDGGYLLGGTSNSDKSGDKSDGNRAIIGEDNYYSSDFWVVKINGEGTKVWDKTYGGSGYDGFTALIAAPDGGYLLGGYSDSGIGGDKSEAGRGDFDYWVIKIDDNGSKIWDKTFGGSKTDDSPLLISSPNGGYILAGRSYSGISGDKSEASRGFDDFWLIKINENGAKIWDKTYGGKKQERLGAIVAAEDGGYLFGGFSDSGVGGDKTNGRIGSWLVKIDEAGNKIWDNVADSESISDIEKTADGGYLLAGYKVFRDPVNGYDNATFWVLKVNSRGAKVGEMAFGEINKVEVLGDIIPATDGGFLLGGAIATFSRDGEIDAGDSMLFDYFIVKINILLSPIIQSFSPEQGASGQTVTITGKNLLRTTGVRFNGVEANFTIVNDTKVTAIIPAAAITGKISLETTGGVTTSEKVFTITTSITAWNMRYGSSLADRFTVVINTPDGGYLSGGHSAAGVSGDKSQATRGGYDFWIVKTDKNGARQWDKTYGGSGDDFLNRIILTADGGYLLAGSSTSGSSGDKTTASRGNQDYWLVKISSTGVKQWDKTYGGSGFDDLRKVNQLSNGDYLLAGQSNSPVSGDKSQASQGGLDYWILRINSAGIKLWDKRYGGANNEYLESFTKTSEGGFLLAGSSASGQSGDKSQVSRGGKDYWLVRINSNGTQLWDKSFGGSQDDELYSVGITANGDYFMAGHSSSGQSGDKSQPSRGSSDYWLLKVSKTGQKLWDKSFGGSGQETLRSVIEATGGGYVLAGTSSSGISGDKSQASRGGYDYWLVKTDAEGNKEYDQRFGGSGTEEFRYIQRTADGGYLLGGRSDSGTSGDRTQSSRGGMDYWLVKVAPGTPVNTNTVAAKLDLSQEESTVEILKLTAYPNPAVGEVTVDFSVAETQPVTLKVYNNQSQEVAILFQAVARQGQKYVKTWLPKQMAPGMYLLRLQTKDKVNTQKIMVTK